MISGKHIAACIVVALLAGGWMLIRSGTLPSLANRTLSTAALDTESTRLGRTIDPVVAAHAPQSGICGLREAHDAFAARVHLAQAAERTLDVQYYIWHDDLSGTLLFDALRAAADRGVRVRLLLDDNNTSGLDTRLAALDSHPNVEVRLFNPFVIRSWRRLSYLTDFSRLNRRMHNKSFTADNRATIVGGRNVGDEYFGATDGVEFADFDVLAVGPVVGEVSAQFDRYWSSDSAYPVERLFPKSSPHALTELAARASALRKDPAAVAYTRAAEASSFVQALTNRRLPLEWALARTISDDPAKALGHETTGELVIEKLKAIFGEPRTSLDLVSPYFVPGSTGAELFRTWAHDGVKIRVLTNSLEATDVAAVHAGYAKRRKTLLSAGITLYELRRSAGAPAVRGSAPMGSSGSSLHAKTFAVDGSRVFVGSFNFDPRSAKLNTEMGFVIESAALARRIQDSFDGTIPGAAYEVRLAGDDRLEWIERRGESITRQEREPGAGFWRRSAVWLLSDLPIEWLL